MRWGYTCSSEEFEASDLVRFAADAEDRGLAFVTVSDHFHPWTTTQGHSPYVWTTLGGIATLTRQVDIATAVTCPLIRQHPAIVAQAAATVAELSGGRFFLGVGTGEALNEHVTGGLWPAIEVRQAMLAEAIDLIRNLFTGTTVDFHGEHYTVENTRLFSAPEQPPAIIVAASGPKSAALAGERGDGLWSTAPRREVVDAYHEAGGEGDVIGQLTVCFDTDEERARETAARIWPNAAIPGQLTADLPTWTHFEQAATIATPDLVASSVVCGPDAAAVVKQAQAFADAGFTAVHFHQVGPDQEGFLSWWSAELADALADLS